MHASTDPVELKSAIEELGHTVANFWNLKQRISKKPLPMFVIELKPDQNSKNIYETKYLLRSKIIFEPSRLKHDIPQCAKCQRYGHTKHFCHQSLRCMKCVGDHATIACPRKERTDNVRCVLCTGNHPANYKGCTIYKELQRAKFPALRSKLPVSKNEKTRPTANSQEGQNTTTNGTTTSKRTYANAVTASKNNISTNCKSYRSVLSQKDTNIILKDTLKDLKNLLQTALNQMNTITTLMADLMTKLPHSLN